MGWKTNRYNLMVLAELHKVDISVRTMSVHNKQLISIIFNIRAVNFGGLPCFYLSGMLFKMFKPLKAHFPI